MEVDQKRWHITPVETAVCFMIISTLLLMPSVGKTDSVSEMQQGVEYVKLRLYPQAVDSFKSVLSQNPTDVNALFHLGNVYKLQDELELAIETYKKILSNAATKHKTVNAQLYGYTHLALAEIYCKQSQLKVAEQHAIEADQTLSNSAETQYRLGYIYTHQAKFDKALVAFNKTLASKPDFAEVYEWLGLIALMQQKPRKAINNYKIAIQKKPFVQSAYYNLAKAYRLLGDMESAKTHLKLFQKMKAYYDQTYTIEGALAEAPKNTALRLKLAETHLEHKNIPAAVTTYQILLRFNPEYVSGYDKLGRLYMELNIPNRAIPMFQKVIELNPDVIEAHVRLGWLYSNQKTYDKAEFHLKKVIQKMPKHTLAYHGLAEVYVKQERLEKAVSIYQKITELDPDDKDARTALRNLERIKK
ncbi:tetratricopeptide repeat protein [Candidatus Poribacteria bacterium]|nr:tetratricopeptide repeat protein [Candidatus Poribacteria bacterium]MYI94616.1 tetratricopeptide repeat protein [Candidatus Poribacteria bacterium]